MWFLDLFYSFVCLLQLKDEPTMYLEKTITQNDWKWTDENFDAQRIEIGVAADEQMRESPHDVINAYTINEILEKLCGWLG